MIYTDPDTNKPFIGEPLLFTGPGAISLIGDYCAPSSLTNAIHCAPAAEGTPRAAPKQRRVVRSMPDARHWSRAISSYTVTGAGHGWRRIGPGHPNAAPCATCASGLVRPCDRKKRYASCLACRAGRK